MPIKKYRRQMHDDASSDASVSPRDTSTSVLGEGTYNPGTGQSGLPSQDYIYQRYNKVIRPVSRSSQDVYQRYNKVIRPVSRSSQDYISEIQQGNQTCI